MNILLTGTSTGIGQATTQALLRAGHTVHGTARKAEDHEQYAGQANYTGHVMDVTDRDAIKATVARVKATGQPLHAVINNAGVAITGPLEQLPESEYRKQLEVNLFGPLAVCQEALPLLHAAREAGHTNVKIINVSSVAGYISSPFTGIYSASKFAMEAMTDALRRELMPFGIDVISIAPGPVKTPIWLKGREQTPNFLGGRYEDVLRYMGDYVKNANDGGLEPRAIAHAIQKSVENFRPRPDQLIMKKSWMARLLTQLPKRVQDRLIRRNLENAKRY